MQHRKDIPGYEGRYAVDTDGVVWSLPFKQRYLLRTGGEAFRTTKLKALARNRINSGYFVVHLHLDNVRTAHLVHRLVAEAFIPNTDPTVLVEVNHCNGDKADCRMVNLEWQTSKGNHDHAVDIGLQPQARAVVIRGPGLSHSFPSMSRAAQHLGTTATTIGRALRTRSLVNGWEVVSP